MSSAPRPLRPGADPPVTRERGQACLLDETDRHLVKMLQVDERVSTGRYDIIVEAFFCDQHHLLAFISDTLGQIQAITAVETFVILDVVKFSYEWEI